MAIVLTAVAVVSVAVAIPARALVSPRPAVSDPRVTVSWKAVRGIPVSETGPAESAVSKLVGVMVAIPRSLLCHSILDDCEREGWSAQVPGSNSGPLPQSLCQSASPQVVIRKGEEGASGVGTHAETVLNHGRCRHADLAPAVASSYRDCARISRRLRAARLAELRASICQLRNHAMEPANGIELRADPSVRHGVPTVAVHCARACRRFGARTAAAAHRRTCGSPHHWRWIRSSDRRPAVSETPFRSDAGIAPFVAAAHGGRGHQHSRRRRYAMWAPLLPLASSRPPISVGLLCASGWAM